MWHIVLIVVVCIVSVLLGFALAVGVTRNKFEYLNSLLYAAYQTRTWTTGDLSYLGWVKDLHNYIHTYGIPPDWFDEQ